MLIQKKYRNLRKRKRDFTAKERKEHERKTLGLHGKKYFFAVYVFFCGEFSSFCNYPVILSKKLV